MAEQKQLVRNLHMTTRLLEHDHAFTWRVRNLPLLKDRPYDSVQYDIHLHPKYHPCLGFYRLEARCSSNAIFVKLGPRGICIESPAESSYLGVRLNRKGDIANIGKLGSALSFRLQWKDGKVFTELGKEVELENGDTLVVKGRLVLPSHCVATEIEKDDVMEVNMDPSKPMSIGEAMKDGFVLA